MRLFPIAAGCLLAAMAAAPAALAADEPLTPFVATAAHADLKQTYEISNFRIGGSYPLDNRSAWHDGGVGGQTLESLGAGPLKVSYIATGTPVRDDAGKIVNAIIISSYYSGDSTSQYDFWFEGGSNTAFSGGALVGPGRLFDTNRYYVVFLDALGLFGTSKPSEGLGLRFPQYSYKDMVQANYRLLTDHLGIANVVLASGVSMGATQTWNWGVLHSGFVDAIMPIGGTTQSDGGDPVGNWTFQLMTAAIQSDPVWRATGGDYYHLPKAEHPNQGVEFGWSVLGLTGYDFKFRASQPWEQVAQDVFYWGDKEGAEASIKARAGSFDAVDLIYRNRAGEAYNINAELAGITARTMVLHITNDQWLNSQLAERAAAKVPGAIILSHSHPLAHYGVFSAPHVYAEEITAFIEDKAFFGGPALAAGGGGGGGAPATGGLNK